MTNIKSIARPYAKAAFAAAKSAHQLPLWSVALKQLSVAAQDKKMQAALKDPRYTQKQLSELFLSVLHAVLNHDVVTSHNEMENLIRVLSENKRLDLFPEISRLFEAEMATETGSVSLTVTSAFAMNDAQKTETRNSLSKQLNATCEIDFCVNEKMIGGMIVRSGNWVMDGSITGQLAKLRNSLV